MECEPDFLQEAEIINHAADIRKWKNHGPMLETYFQQTEDQALEIYEEGIPGAGGGTCPAHCSNSPSLNEVRGTLECAGTALCKFHLHDVRLNSALDMADVREKKYYSS